MSNAMQIMESIRASGDWRRFTLAVLVSLVLTSLTQQGWAIEATTIMPNEPRFPRVPAVKKYSPRLKELWLEALARPEIELKRQAADSIALAQRSDMSGLQETAPQLLAQLEAPQAHPVVRLAVVRALIAIDARNSAAVLMKHAQSDGWEMAQVVEPALAEWKHAPMQAVWLKRLNDPATMPRPLLLTIRCISIIGLTDAVPRLRELALNSKLGPDVRLAAARVLSVLKPSGLEADAAKLAAGDPAQHRIDHLISATFLSHHQGGPAEQLLLQLAVNPEPAVDVIALRRLLELGPLLVEPINDKIVQSKDASVRFLATQFCLGQKTPGAVGHLGTLMDDVDPLVRKAAQQNLIELAKIDALNPIVRETAMKVLLLDSPRGLEQAALVIGAIDHEPAAERLLKLLTHEVPAVSITAAWSLRCLQVPETAKPIYEKVKADTEKSMIPLALTAMVDQDVVNAMYNQQQHLLEALGLLRHKEAEELLYLYLPTPPVRLNPPDIRLDTVWNHELRMRAIWALGKIFENDPQTKPIENLSNRLRDQDSDLIRAMSAISLGRMQAKSKLSQLQSFFKPGDEFDPLKFGCAWGAAQLTGEPIVPFTMTPTLVGRGGWFLEPLD